MPVTYTAPSTQADSQETRATVREKRCRKMLYSIAAVAGLALAAHFAVLLWSRHEFTVVEAIVALHASMLAHGRGIYFDLNHYPFTVSPYGPVFYGISGFLNKWLGQPYMGGRLLSFSALLGGIWLCFGGVSVLAKNRYAGICGAILAASTSNLLVWGTVGQSDMLAACFSLAAFVAFLRYRHGGRISLLALAGVLVVSAVLTKQTSLAGGAAIGLTLLVEERRRAGWWILGTVSAGVVVLLILNTLTQGHYYEDAIVANVAPFQMSLAKLRQHADYLLLTGSGVLIVAGAGIWRLSRRVFPVFLYAALAAGVWTLTAPKIGSDLNYQIEMMLALCMCAGCSLDLWDFFPSLFGNRQTWVTLLQVPLLLHVVVNVTLTTRTVAERVLFEPFKRRETEALQSFVDGPGPVLSVQYDALVHYRGHMDVEPYIYSLLVAVGLTDPTPFLHDIEDRHVPTVILSEDIFHPGAPVADPETLHMPAAQIDALRRNYRVVAKIAGPYNVYVYQPRTQSTSPTGGPPEPSGGRVRSESNGSTPTDGGAGAKGEF